MTNKFHIGKKDGTLYPMGAVLVPGGVHFSFAHKGTDCILVLYPRGGKKPAARIGFPKNFRMGDVWAMTVLGELEGLEYVYEIDGEEMPDPYGRAFTGRNRWGNSTCPVRTLIPEKKEEYDWEGDVLPQIPYEDCILYHLHVRGFTKHSSSGLDGAVRGTFKGVEEKIPYLKELGVTTLVLMPPGEFEEIQKEKVQGQAGLGSRIRPEGKAEASGRAGLKSQSAPEGKAEASGQAGVHRQEHKESPMERSRRINYWGYERGFYFSPKYSYSSKEDPGREFKDLVKALHREGMELVAELYFDGKEASSYALDAARFWAMEYHVDGIRFVGYAPVKLLGEDPYLCRLKLFADSWEGVEPGEIRHLAQYGDGFMFDMRSVLKGDEDSLNRLANRCIHNPKAAACINYMADTNGFTMMDMVSYDEKHNEENGEGGRDGTDYNQSWNCGAEGPCRKGRVVKLRRKQLRNAFLMLLLSQGTPLILMGDEMGRTKKGNNNSYCQDNDISWLNWGLLRTHSWLYDFAKQAIRFRREHGVFHQEREPLLMDRDSLGMPDVSFHGIKTWYPMFDRFCRQLGVLYCGPYGKKAGKAPDDYFYVAYNMHWEPHEFALPNLPRGMEWHVAFNTDEDRVNGMYQPGEEPLVSDQKSFMVMARTVVVLMGKAGGKK